jgi:RNA polymerase sporulation-specific sigma factor
MQPLTDEQKQFAEDNHSLIYKFLKQRNFTIDEEWYGAAAIGFTKAVATFNADKNIKFATYAYTCMTNEILMGCRKLNREKSLVVCSLNDDITANDDDGRTATLADIIPDKANRFDDVETALVFNSWATKLSDREKRLIALTSYGMHQRDAAQLVGTSQGYASRLIIKAKNSLLNTFA